MTSTVLQSVPPPAALDALARPAAAVEPANAAGAVSREHASSRGTIPPAPGKEPNPQELNALQAALESAAEQIESYLRSVGRSLEFRVDSATGRVVVTVRDAATGAVIRQIPAEEALRMARSLEDASSVLVDLVV